MSENSAGAQVGERCRQVRARLAEHDVEAFVTMAASNRRYLTGFTGSAGLAVLLPGEAVLLVDFRYTEQATQQVSGWRVEQVESFHDALASLLQAAGVKRVAFEAAHVAYATWQAWQEKLDFVQWIPTRDVVEAVRAVKDEEELSAIRRAVALGDRAFRYLLDEIRPGVTERALAVELESFLRREGAEGMSFAPIVASGPNGALPHARPGDRPLEKGDFVVLDFGCVVDGYCSDMTRTVCLGPPDPKQKQLYELVLRAQEAGLAALKPAVNGRDVDATARRVIEEAGYGDYFGHGLGHGVGLQVHESIPRLSKKADVMLEAGMVTSVEPGIYVPGWGGIRIEELVVVNADGADVLTSSPKELIALPV